MMFNEQIVDFGNYLYFEYVNGSVIKLYNHDKYYQTVSSDTKIVVDDITIDLNDDITGYYPTININYKFENLNWDKINNNKE